MRIKLSYKLFGAFFLILAIVFASMLLSRYIFALTFRNYVHQVEVEKLKGLVPLLQKEYRDHGNWDHLKIDARRWRDLVRAARGGEHPYPRPPFNRTPPNGVEPPPGHAISPPKRPPFGVLLMDARRRRVVGVPAFSERQDAVAIEVDGQVVGWLEMHIPEPFKSDPPAVLLERQARQLFMLGAVVIGLTGVIAFLFLRSLLRPIHQLMRGTRELARRNFNIRIDSTTGDELGQLAVNFNAMARTLENYEKIRLQWLTDISHELRTPLAILRGEIEALQDGVREPTTANLASLHAEILGISRLVEDLHLLSMADSNRLLVNKRRLSPWGVLNVVIEGYQPRLERCRIKTETRLEAVRTVRVDGDADRLGQVFGNILENACKYVHPPGSLNISGQADDQAVTFYFQDSGPGVPEAALPRLFDRLYRVESSRSRDSGGSGLGLSICRHIVESHGGRIWAQRSSEGGLSIGVSLPLARGKDG